MSNYNYRESCQEKGQGVRGILTRCLIFESGSEKASQEVRCILKSGC